MIEVEIDKDSGFCFGVVTAIESAERELGNTDTLYCLGDIVHNSLEVERLEHMGLHTIDHEGLSRLRDRKVLLRAHGEPPSTYALAKRNNITIIDATCPVVLRLQRKIHKCYQETRANNTQLVIYGKKGHAEVNGLVGQTEGTAIVIEKIEDLDRLDFTRAISLFSQTTKSLDGFKAVVAEIKQRMAEGVEFNYYDTICRQVANRLPNIKRSPPATIGSILWPVVKVPTERCCSRSAGKRTRIRFLFPRYQRLPSLCPRACAGSGFAALHPLPSG